jgi:histone-lysine N-methyltransferase EZH2
MGEDIKSGEYIGEYTGEAISIKEGDRRVTIYDYQKTMYLFRLNSSKSLGCINGIQIANTSM